MKEQWRGRRVSSSDQLNQISLETISEDLESKKFLCSYKNIFTMTKKRITLIGKQVGNTNSGGTTHRMERREGGMER